VSTNAAGVKVAAIDHVGIDVADLPAGIGFYRRAFDLTVGLQGELPEYTFAAAMLTRPDGWHIELFKRDGAAPRPVPDDADHQHDVLGIGHVCLAADDVDAAYDRLVSMGVATHLPPMPYPTVPEWRMVYLADPEGKPDRADQPGLIGAPGVRSLRLSPHLDLGSVPRCVA
jgi:glyoxylase I family protein